MRVIISIHGIDELIKANTQFIKALEKGEITEQILDKIVRSAKYNAPRKTGTLVKAIRWVKEGNGRYAIICDATNQNGDPYPNFLEFGTRFIPIGSVEAPRVYKTTTGKTAQMPFIRPAIYRMSKNFAGMISDVVKKIYK